ncbi:copper-translocating P-type ATPase [Bisbaumannia pacifica]|uniref:P-type Zn(2+) transporter n=1 Tax=Bisbaumannia pacifica TaxID=77098 RepID=A0A510X5M4_9GAMM|nr:cation-translocating P-type ATPase [Halomonas pacifica]GEK45735.1 copper-translocating P-type ATPase [Halomonas pacifica]
MTTSCCGGQPRTDATETPLPDDARTLRLHIAAMDCPTEEALLRRALADEPGILALRFDLIRRVLTVAHDGADEAAIQARIATTGMSAEPLNDATAEAPPTPPAEGWGRLALAAALALAAELLHWFVPTLGWAPPLLALAAIGLAGLATWKKGWIALRHRSLNIHALMSVAVTGALLIGQWAEAAMVLVLFTLAERIEARSLGRARDAIRGLLDLAPATARVHQDDGDWQEVAAEMVIIGSRVRVRPGERVPLDGEILSGRSALDESPITGEGLPRDKGPGDAVFAGTINQQGEFDYRTTRRADDTTLARIIHAVEEAQASRAPTQRLVDRFAAIYTPLVFALAIATALAWPLFGGAWLEGIYRALVLLVIACPCALVISTPVTIVSGLAAAARSGILIKGGHFLEQGHRLAWLAFDKTGTLTEGKPRLHHWEAWDSTDRRESPARLAWALAGRSNHPVSRALAAALSEEPSAARSDALAETPHGVVERPGLGVEASLGERRLWLGNRRLAVAHGVAADLLEARLAPLEARGQSPLILGEDDRPLALFAVSDPLKAGSHEAIAELHRLGIQTLMLSGDNRHSVAAIAAEAGIDEARGELLPEDKLRLIEEKANQASIGMVGDGINDAPALARADIGFAMGGAGSDAAIETADVALMDDDPRKLPRFVALSRATRRVLIQNIAFAIAIKVLFLGLAFSGHATLWMAVFADMGASLLVVANGLKLLRRAAPSPGA